MSIEQFANNASSTLNGGINNSVTSLVVTSAANFPAAGNFRIKVEDEIMLVTAVSSNTFTVTRGVEGSAAASHGNTTPVFHVMTKASLLNLLAEGVAIGVLASLPAAERAGRIYLPSDLQGSIYRDTGSAWEKFSPGNASVYPPFVPSGIDDEFDDNNFSGWTVVDSGSHQPTVTELNDVCSIYHPGSDAAAELHAWMKSTTVSSGDIIEIAFRGFGLNQAHNICGLIMADGTTYGAGSQIIFYLSPEETKLARLNFTGYDTDVGGFTTYDTSGREPGSDMFLRLKYEGSNNFRGYVSCDGISWADLTGSFSRTLTPTEVGFFVTSWGGTAPYTWSVRYFRKL